VLIRFGRWADILLIPFPEDTLLFCTRTATLHYARGLSLAACSRVHEAESELAALQTMVARPSEELKGRLAHNNCVLAVLAVAEQMLRGEIMYRKDEFESAFGCLREAARLEDGLNFDEPWGWVSKTNPN
jgi:hypothetical protein